MDRLGLSLSENDTAYIKINPNASPLWRLAYVYSIYQLVLVILTVRFPHAFPEWVKDYVRAVSVIVAIGWFVLYMYVGSEKIFDIYKSLFPFIHSPIVIYVIDMITHVLPVFIVGWPHNPASFFVAMVFVTLWYISVRTTLPYMYNLLPIAETDVVFYTLVPALTIVLYYISSSSK